MLPDVNGNVVCQTIKRNQEFEDIRILIVSGVANPSEIEGLINAGAEDFMAKPFDISELVEKVSGILQLQ